MAEIHGKSGSVAFTNLTAGAKSWSLDYTADTTEVTDFADAGCKSYIPGLTGWTASVEANYDSANTAKPGDSATLTLVPGTNLKYEGTAILTSMKVNTPVDGNVTVTYDFQGTGALTIDTTP